jgi:MscS family membrane protein
MNDKNITQDEIRQIAHKQELIYVNALEKFLLKKKLILDQPKPYQEELFILNKLLKRNKAQGKGYAIIRDEVFIKSYQILQAQNKMARHILRTLDHYDFDEFDTQMNDQFVKNQEAMQKIDTVDYKPFLELQENNKVLQEAQKNIKDYYALIEINADMLRYFSIFEKRMYRLNKYSKFKILPLALYLDHTEFGKRFNDILYPYNLSIVKLLLILMLINRSIYSS